MTLLKRYLPYNVRKQLAETLVLSRLDYGNAVINNAPMYLFKQLQRVQNATASFVRKRYSKREDVIGLGWILMKERSDYSVAKLAWKSVNKPEWPKFLPMEKQVPLTRGTRSADNGTKIRCTNNLWSSFEYVGSKIFNDLPLAARNCVEYKSFCRITKNYFLDKSLARSLS